MSVNLKKENDMLKLSWVSKLKPPVPKGAEPTEEELNALYQYFHRRNKIAMRMADMGLFGLPVGVIVAGLLAVYFSVDASYAITSAVGLFGGLMLAGIVSIEDEKESARKPLAQMSEEDQAEALRLIRVVPEARKLSKQANEQGRTLRAFDLKAMREFERTREAKRFKREAHRLGAPPDSAQLRLDRGVD